MLETPSIGKLSVVVYQLLPPSVDFQHPPDGAPIYIALLPLVSTTTQFILPTPGLPEVPHQVDGPKGDQLFLLTFTLPDKR